MKPAYTVTFPVVEKQQATFPEPLLLKPERTGGVDVRPLGIKVHFHLPAFVSETAWYSARWQQTGIPRGTAVARAAHFQGPRTNRFNRPPRALNPRPPEPRTGGTQRDRCYPLSKVNIRSRILHISTCPTGIIMCSVT